MLHCPDYNRRTTTDHAEGVEATIDYLVPGSRLNRRYVAPGAELNTGRYAPHTVFIRNGRSVQSVLGLDTQGFVLARQPSLVANFKDKSEVDTVYAAEVAAPLCPPFGFRRPLLSKRCADARQH
jgi:hypothetical protein